MNKRILLTLIFVLTAVLSVGAIYASDVNTTDSIATDADDASIAISDDTSDLQVSESEVDSDSADVLKSENSSTLSTNTENSNVISDGNPSKIDASKTITAKDVTKYYKGSAKYYAKFLDDTGAALANTNVKITVNGNTYTRTTDAKGVASLDINLNPGTYKVTTTNPVTGYKLTTTFKILSTITANDITKVYTDGRKFYAKFYKSSGKVLANKNVRFKINGQTYTVKTNSKGIAGLSLTDLMKGTYKIKSYNNDGLVKSNTVKVVRKSATSLTAKDYIFLKSDTKVIKVRLLNKYGYAPAKGHVVKFKVNGQKFYVNTNKNGYAKLRLPSLNDGVYTVKYSFAADDFYKASSAKSKVTIISSKTPTFTLKGVKTFGHGAGTSFKVALTSKSVPLAGQTVKLTVNGDTYKKTTDSKGIVYLPINLDNGKYTVAYSVAGNSKISAKSGSTPISVVERAPTSVQWKTATSFYEGTYSCQVLALDSNNQPIAGQTVKLTVNSVTYTAKTASNGYATFNANFPTGKYSVSYTYVGDNGKAPSTGTTQLNILKIDKVSVKNIIAASNNLKTYYANNNKFPSTITAGGISFTMPEFLYLMSQAISQIGNSKFSDIPFIKGVSAPATPTGDTINANLMKDNYLTVAKNLANYISAHKQAPNYASSNLGKIVYQELLDAESRVLAYYGDHNQLPNYVVIHTSSGSATSQAGTGLNEKNTIKDLSAYLKATTNCQVDNSAIKNIVNSVTKGLTSTAAKAKAIYNYVRDAISYSFYYDTKYGAVGTLNAKKGNCVDQAHLLVAMFRTADIPARYVHGTCRFSSGSTYGHVWTQVLVDGKWTVADATSERNSFGNIVNWNTNSFSLKGIYASISF